MQKKCSRLRSIPSSFPSLTLLEVVEKKLEKPAIVGGSAVESIRLNPAWLLAEIEAKQLEMSKFVSRCRR